ncbi:MAG: class I SAM-dependent methyltransferase [Planctomycetes bacterium]|nr:class I SAM-dependent methyltransferase [Planctomycetota bacterium]
MSEMQNYWELWSPIWSYIEDYCLDLTSIQKLIPVIKEPALVVGAGQGLLVEELQKSGIKVDGIDAEPQMVAFAKKRRNLEIILANGNKMPFADNAYQTSIIATGVVDFIDDEEQIQSIINETLRITDDAGKVFIAFYKIGSSEQLSRLIGLITDDGRLHFKRLYQFMRLKPFAFLKVVKKEANIGYFCAFRKLMKLQLLNSKKEKETMKQYSKLWKEVSNPEQLVDCVPESVPYRSEEMIRDLFKKLGIPIREVLPFDSCTIVQV